MASGEDQPDAPNDDLQDERDAARRATLSAPLTSEDFRPPSVSARVECAARSRRGSSRSINADHYLVLRLTRGQETVATSLSASDVPPHFEEQAYAMFVADGLGEGGIGSVASRVALSTIAHLALHYGRWNVRIEPGAAAEIMERAAWFYARADAAVSARIRAQPHLSGMSTALTVAYSVGDELFVAHVGHSRAYLFRDGALILLTRDHTIDQKLPGAPGSSPVDKRAEDLQHILTDAVGAEGGPPRVDVEQFPLKHGDVVLLCTNGLTDAVDDDGIAEVMASRRVPAEQCRVLTDLAAERGGRDDVTVVVAQYRIP